MATTTITVDNITYDISEFNLAHALSGGTLFAEDLELESAVSQYYPVTEFMLAKVDFAVEFGYQAKIQNQTWKFDEFGFELHGKYQLYTGTATITPHDAGDNQEQTEIDPETHQPVTTYYNLTSLNYRENVALQVLNAMIYHVPDPISYDDAAIKLLVRKSFTFSEEFMSQALTIRTQNAHVDPDTGQIVPDASTTEEALNNISTVLTGIKASLIDTTGQTPVSVLTELSSVKDALIDTSGQTPVTVLTELTGIKTAEQGIQTALSGSGGNSLADQVASISESIGTLNSGDPDMLTRIANLNTAVNNVDTTVGSLGGDIGDIKNEISYSGTGNDRLYNILDVKLGEIRSGVYSGPTSNALSKLNDIQVDTANIRSQVNSIENEISYSGVGNSRLYNILDVRLANIDRNTQ